MFVNGRPGNALAIRGAEQMPITSRPLIARWAQFPSQQTLVMERFFDESGGMQLVLHRHLAIESIALGLALRKRFCRSFNFELQAAATDDAIVISLGTQHSFPLEEVFRYLMQRPFAICSSRLCWMRRCSRFAGAGTRPAHIAVPRFRGGAKIAAPFRNAWNRKIFSRSFPGPAACLEHIVGDREIPIIRW